MTFLWGGGVVQFWVMQICNLGLRIHLPPLPSRRKVAATATVSLEGCCRLPMFRWNLMEDFSMLTIQITHRQFDLPLRSSIQTPPVATAISPESCRRRHCIAGRLLPPADVSLELSVIRIMLRCETVIHPSLIESYMHHEKLAQNHRMGSILGAEVEVPTKSYSTQLAVISENEETEDVSIAEDGGLLKPHIFTLTVPQVDGGSNVSVKARWSQKIMYKDGEFILIVPYSFSEYVTPAGKKLPKKEKIELNISHTNDVICILVIFVYGYINTEMVYVECRTAFGTLRCCERFHLNEAGWRECKYCEKGSILGAEVEVPTKSYSTQLALISENEETEDVSIAEDGGLLKPHIFTLTVPQVDGGSNVSVKARWSQKIMYKDGEFILSVPYSFPEYVTLAGKKLPKKEKIELNISHTNNVICILVIFVYGYINTEMVYVECRTAFGTLRCCERFHLNEAGWRECKYCEKKIYVNTLTSSSLNFDCTITPLFEKVLSASDAGRIGRLVLPKACAEAYFPVINTSEGVPVKVRGVKGKEWTFQFRYWPNNNSRMYVLEGVYSCIQHMQMEAGDTAIFSRLNPGDKLVLGWRKAIVATDASALPNPVNGDLPAIMDKDTSKLDSEQKSLIQEKKKTRNIGSISKRLHIHSEDAMELKFTWEEAQ
ncbi:zinc finger, CW-type, DNA-binding pseudobarrel domain protein [Artemisia annua]|uniref:Zinc finger, CW-type, DNA-binding pseudobarrel domain protein n=1 Tax=Artemisia annua TaxID=35608 RepID=A0A2U1MI35_ARTAN|nr:zinc finger, CW-type, DNA-binding pseudobarrel domain protein [Artemisia annua]